MNRIYLDNHSTTPVDPIVLQAMLPWFTEKFGNAASRTHAYGWEAGKAVEEARERVASLIGAEPDEIVFTSGATESNNLAIKGCVRAVREKGSHVITTAIEHPAVLDPCRALEATGEISLTVLPVDGEGVIRMADLEAAITPQTVLISVMSANNEIGVLQPVEEIGKLCKSRGIFFHSDGAQAVGRIPVNVDTMGCDLLSLTAHKMYGPKGIGALYVRKWKPRVKLISLQEGGGHERGWRSGTLPVPLIVGFGEACRISEESMEEESARIRVLRDRLSDKIFSGISHVHLNGAKERRLPGNLNVSFEFVEGESLILGMQGVAVSTGSACSSARAEPSHVLKALGRSEALHQSSLRFGLGRFTTSEEIEEAFERLSHEVSRLRELSPLYDPKNDA